MDLHLIIDEPGLYVNSAYDYVLVTKSEAVATNGKLLVVVPVLDVLPKNIVKHIPEGGWLIHPDHWVAMMAKRIDIKYRDSRIWIEGRNPEKSGLSFKPIKNTPGVPDRAYPDYQKVIREKKRVPETVESVAINGYYLGLMQSAMGCNALTLTFYGVNSMIEATPYPQDYNRAMGYIMPIQK